MGEDLENTTRIAAEIAEDAAKFILTGYRTGTAIEKKGEIDLVTAYDVECERRITAALAKAFPHDRVVGEEMGAAGEGARVWFVDPIDGTTNFAHGHPFFCVSMGLFDGDTPLVGIVAAPALGVTWVARRGGGATRNGVACRVSDRARLGDALVATGFAYDRWNVADDNLGEHDRFVKSTRGVRRCGSAALDLALVADGTFDAYWEQSLKPWDIAAGISLVTEAGGTITDYLGAATRPEAGQVVATNGHFHDGVLETIGAARAERGLDRAGHRRDRTA